MGSKPPKPDPRIGQAALKQAEIGERAQIAAEGFAQQQIDMGREYQQYMMDRASVTDGWAAQDRERQQTVGIGLQDDWIAEAQGIDSAERKQMAASEAVGDVRQQMAMARQQQTRQQAAMGVNPASGRAGEASTRMATTEALGAAGAANAARRQAEATGRQMRATSINMMSGMEVNPGQSMQMGNAAGSAGMSAATNGINSGAATTMGGAQMAMSGQQGMAATLNQQHQNQVQAHANTQGMLGDIAGAAGTAAGFMMMSSKDAKTKKAKPMSVLDAVRDMPVEEWEYKQGMGDGGGKRHIGPYAEDFKKATGLGNGKEISIIDAIGVNMGAVQELAAKVDKIEARAA